MNAADFDLYRSRYPEMTYDNMIDWHSRLWTDHKDQTHFDSDATASFFSSLEPGQVVYEIGGWRGELASVIAKDLPVYDRWVNQEICSEARSNSVCNHPGYSAVPIIYSFSGASVFLASHSLEHMSGVEIHNIVTRGIETARFVYIDTPSGQVQGSTSMHIVSDPWIYITPILSDWNLLGQTQTAKWFEKP